MQEIQRNGRKLHLTQYDKMIQWKYIINFEAMKNIYSILKKYLGEIMIIVGSGFFTYNILQFSYTGHFSEGLKPKKPSLTGELLSGVGYYYNQDRIVLITFGVLLVVTGILIVKHKKIGTK